MVDRKSDLTRAADFGGFLGRDRGGHRPAREPEAGEKQHENGAECDVELQHHPVLRDLEVLLRHQPGDRQGYLKLRVAHLQELSVILGPERLGR